MGMTIAAKILAAHAGRGSVRPGAHQPAQGDQHRLQADRWEAGSPPLEILMAGGFMPFFTERLRSAGLIEGEAAT
jgi:hypothetical protein